MQVGLQQVLRTSMFPGRRSVLMKPHDVQRQYFEPSLAFFVCSVKDPLVWAKEHRSQTTLTLSSRYESTPPIT